MITTWDVTIPSLTGDEPRRAYLYLPQSYEEEPERRYPVLYMFDGQNVFYDSDATYGKSWGLKDYMDYTGTQLIIAAVECNTSQKNLRLSEYSPYSFRDPSLGYFRGKGKKTMDWMAGEFKESIDADLRTLPDREHTFIAGSSMGGLMSLYALMAYNEVYSRAAALSPSLWVSPGNLNRQIREASLAGESILYMDYGSQEIDNHYKMLRYYNRTCSLLLEKGIYLNSRIVPWGDHTEESWERQLPFFMSTLMYGME